MNKEKLQEIHSKRFLSDRFKEVNFEDQNNLQFFLANYELNGKTIIEGKCFTNKSFNSWWYYRFKSVEQFNQKCLDQIKANNERQESKKKYQEERTKPHSLKVGDILYCSWGYDQTNVDYFKVSQVIGKRKIKIIGLANSLESDGIHDKASPSDSIGNYWTQKQFYCEVEKKWKRKNVELTKYASSDNTVRISSFAWASLWDGKPKYQTNAYMGH
nr:hypothetical protein [uncultured Mediterranean phage uvMED]